MPRKLRPPRPLPDLSQPPPPYGASVASLPTNLPYSKCSLYRPSSTTLSQVANLRNPDLAETAELELSGLQQADWLHDLECEHDNLRAALAWCTRQGETEMALRLAAALWMFWAVDGYLSEGRRWLEAALNSGNGLVSRERAKALRGLGHLAWKLSQYATARASLEESLRLYRELEEREGVAAVLQDLGRTVLEQGERAPAKTYFEQALELHRELGAKKGISYALPTFRS